MISALEIQPMLDGSVAPEPSKACADRCGNKVQGHYYVALFKAECLKRGLSVSNPEADNDAYDVIVDSGARLFRVQVKGTGQNMLQGRYGVVTARGCDAKIPYTDKEIDVVALYIEKTGNWHIIKVVGRFPVKTWINRMYPESKNNWSVFNN